MQIVSNLGRELKDPDTKTEGRKDAIYIQRAAEVIKAKLPGIKPEPVTLEPCCYTVSLEKESFALFWALKSILSLEGLTQGGLEVGLLLEKMTGR